MILGWLDEAQEAGARLAPACREVGLNTSTVQRWRAREGGDDLRHGPKTTPANKTTPAERKRALEVMNSPEYRDLSPKQIVPKLADKGEYIGSESTLYRILHEEKLLAQRGRAAAPKSKPPAERRATGPGQVWSWDITYLRSPKAGVFFYMYVFIDVWSRKVVAYDVRESESTEHAAEMLEGAIEAEGLTGVDLVLHSDNGSPMRGGTLKAMMEWLGVIASFSRPHVSDDNPYSESLFKTMKYSRWYPKKPFGSCAEALRWADRFVHWYHHEHLHSALGFITPLDRHEGRADAIFEHRTAVYEAARKRHPNRWSRGKTRTWKAPPVVLLNPTKDTRLEMAEKKLAA